VQGAFAVLILHVLLCEQTSCFFAPCSFPEHPVSEALFNFIAAWGVLFLPVILTEKKSAKVSGTAEY